MPATAARWVCEWSERERRFLRQSSSLTLGSVFPNIVHKHTSLSSSYLDFFRWLCAPAALRSFPLRDLSWQATNTFRKLIPEGARNNPEIERVMTLTRPAVAVMTLYVGLNGTPKELGLKSRNIWAYFGGNKLEEKCNEFLEAQIEDILEGSVVNPLAFISMSPHHDPSASERFPGKTTIEVVFLANWRWFEAWKNERVKKRGEDYEAIKNGLGRRVWSQVVQLLPQLEDKVELFMVGSPLSNNFYLNSTCGEIYGLDHNIPRFSAEVAMTLRAQTPIERLLLTGQDSFSCGFAPSMFSGLFTASAALGRPLYLDLMLSRMLHPPRGQNSKLE
eukprot:m.849271 g.849271  ORF g.849271 m.849271 type:complete len:333 (+) comp59570_c0_seq14:1130-2128(+)